MTIENLDARIKGGKFDGLVNMLLEANAVGREEIHEFIWGEVGVGHTSKYGIDTLGSIWDEALVGSGSSGIGATGEELNSGSTSAVSNRDCTGKLDARGSISGDLIN